LINARESGGVHEHLRLTPTEKYRFCRAIYQVELEFTLARNRNIATLTSEALTDRQLHITRLAPWETCQILHVLVLLELRLAQGQ